MGDEILVEPLRDVNVANYVERGLLGLQSQVHIRRVMIKIMGRLPMYFCILRKLQTRASA
jgi:hypothetical protein